jgi:hypothetical protein
MKEKGKSMRLGTGQAVLAHLMEKWFADIHFKADFHLQPSGHHSDAMFRAIRSAGSLIVIRRLRAGNL